MKSNLKCCVFFLLCCKHVCDFGLVPRKKEKNSKIHVFGTIRMYVFYLIQNIKYWKCPAISKKIVPCFMYPVFIELYSSANKLFSSLLFCRSSLLLALWFTFHLFVCLCLISLPSKTYRKCVFEHCFHFRCNCFVCFMMLWLPPSSIFMAIEMGIETTTIYIQITFCLFVCSFVDSKIKHAKL